MPRMLIPVADYLPTGRYPHLAKHSPVTLPRVISPKPHLANVPALAVPPLRAEAGDR